MCGGQVVYGAEVEAQQAARVHRRRRRPAHLAGGQPGVVEEGAEREEGAVCVCAVVCLCMRERERARARERERERERLNM